jgi:hypothetical protein
MTSLAAAIDEEMKEIQSLSEGRKNSSSRRAESPLPGGRHLSPDPRPRDTLDTDSASRVRSTSRGITGIPFAMPKSAPSSPRGRNHPDLAYKFETLPSIARVSQAGPKPRAMSSVYGTPSGILARERQDSTNGSVRRSQSNSPAPGWSGSARKRDSTVSSPTSVPGDSGSDVDLPLRSRRKASDSTKATATSPSGGIRLATDDDGVDDDGGDDSAAVESSDNTDSSSDWEDGWAATKSRGRRRSRTESGGTDRMGREIITAKSLMATAVEEGNTILNLCSR